MLFLNPPYYSIEGITVFPDHDNPLQKYFLPALPHLTTIHDEALGMDIPQFGLIKYRGDAGTGGFLNFDVNLGYDEEILKKVRRRIKQIERLDEEPLLAPVPLVDGTVRLLMLGKDSAADDADNGDDSNDIGFVLKIDHASKPALYGSNQAIFSVALDENGAQIIEESLDGELLPIGVIYSLEFLALRPAYNVTITADWERVQHHFEESFGMDSIFLAVSVEEVIDELIEDQVIQIKVDTFAPEDEDDIGFVARRDRALNDFKDMVLESFFVPSLEPPTSGDGDSTGDDIVDASERLAFLAATGGLGGLLPTFSYKKVETTRIDKKRLNFSMTERNTVRRTIYPQAHLSGMFKLFRDGGVDMSRFLTEVTLGHDWFKNRNVTATSLVDFVNDSIDSVNLTLTYGSRPKTIVLTPDKESGSVKWNSILDNDIMQREVDYEYKVNFKGVNSAERPAVVHSPKLMTVGDQFEVNPRGNEFYYLDNIKIGARSNFPWDEYPDIEIHLQYEDEDNGIDIKDSFVLDKTTKEIDWKRFRVDKEKSPYDIKIVFRAADNQDRTIDWHPLDQELYTIGNPRPKKHVVRFVPAVSWDEVHMMLIDVTYEDRMNRIFEEESITLTKEDPGPGTFAIDLIDRDHRMVQYKVTLLFLDGSAREIPRSTTSERTVIIKKEMRGHQLITVKCGEPDFAAKDILRIDVALSYEDASAGFSFSDNVRLNSPQDQGVFEFDYADPNADKYEAEANVLFTNGMVRAVDYGLIDDPVLTVTVD